MIKKRLILQKCIRWNHFRENYRPLLSIFFKKERILLFLSQKQPPDVFYEERCCRNFAHFTDECFCRFYGVLQNFQNLLFKKKYQRQLSGFIIQLSVWFSAIYEISSGNSLWGAKIMVIIIIITIIIMTTRSKSFHVYEAANKSSFSFQPKCVILT